jgi:hypothetical protein
VDGDSIAGPCLRLTLSHTLTQYSNSTSLSESERQGRCLCWELIKLPFCHFGVGLIFEPGFLPVGGRVSPLDQTICWHLVDHFFCGLRDAHWQQGMWKTTISTIPDKFPEILQESWTDTQDTEAIQQEAMFCCTSTDSVDPSQRLSPWEQRGFTLYTLANRLQKQKSRFNPYMVVCNSIGYFTPSAMWPSSHLDSLSFISPLCLPPFPHSIIRTQTCLLLFWPSFLL